jgi:hypothetical protein
MKYKSTEVLNSRGGLLGLNEYDLIIVGSTYFVLIQLLKIWSLDWLAIFHTSLVFILRVYVRRFRREKVILHTARRLLSLGK